MAAPASILLQGQTPIEIDHAYQAIVTKFRRSFKQGITKHKSATSIGLAKAIPDVGGSFSIMTPQAGLTFDPNALNAKPDGFTISFPYGVGKILILHCVFTDWNIDVDPASGNITGDFSFEGTGETVN